MDSIKDVVRQTPEEGRRIYRPEHCGNNHKEEDNSPKTLNDESKIYLRPILEHVSRKITSSSINQFSIDELRRLFKILTYTWALFDEVMIDISLDHLNDINDLIIFTRFLQILIFIRSVWTVLHKTSHIGCLNIHGYIGCLNIHGTHVTAYSSTNYVVLFFVSDLKIVYYNNY